MRTRLILVSLLILLNITLWFIQLEFPSSYLTKAFYTTLALLIIYVIIKVIFEQIIAKRIVEPKTRYESR